MRKPSMSWRQKLITTALLCLVLPSVTTLALTGIHTKNEFKKKAVVKAEQSLEVADLYISNIVNDIITVFNTIQYDSEMITDLRLAWSNYERGETKTVDFFYFKNISEKLDTITLLGEKTYITILLPGGLHFTNYSTYNMDLSLMYEEPWIQNMANDPVNTTNWIGSQSNYVHYDSNKHPHVITVARTFQLYANSPNAYIILSKPEQQFHQIFNTYQPDQIMVLKDAEGKIISQTDHRLIGQELPLSYVRGKDTLVDWHDKEYISISHPLPFAGWHMQSLMSYKEVVGTIGNFMNYIFVLQILFFLIFSVVMFYLLRQLTYPIIRLARTASKVEGGNLDVRSRIAGHDEIGQLGLSFDSMLDRIKETIKQVEWEQNRKRIVELELLQAQINPHFLFNTLNSIRLQVIMKGESDIAKIIGSLSTLLRMTINRNNEFLPLHEEVSTVEQYVILMNFRHDDGVKLTTNLASDTLLETIPRFTLQPLIENAYIHGLKQKHGEISVFSHKLNSMLYITVLDNGSGLSESELNDLKNMLKERTSDHHSQLTNKNISGIGLRNINERLKIIYGDAYTMSLESSPDNGFKITIMLPLLTKEKEDE